MQKQKRNPIAKMLRYPKYRKRIVLSKKTYNRKKEKKKNEVLTSQYNS